MDYTQLFIKFALGILTLIIQINVFGKSNLAPTTALDQLQNYVLGGIIGGLIYNSSITIIQFLRLAYFTKNFIKFTCFIPFLDISNSSIDSTYFG